MIIKLQKLYPHQGYLTARARDYQVAKCIKAKQDLYFDFHDKIMTIPYKQLKSRIIEKSEPFQSMFNPNQTYRTYGFKWSADKVMTKEEELMRFSRLCL